MLNTLLATKYYIPPPRPNLIPRPRLVGKLDESMVQGQRLLFISAPAGYGKTTLLAAWLHDRLKNTAVAWISLDDGDNDRTRFLTYLITAIQTVRPGVGETALAMLQSSRLPSLEIVLISLLNDIAASLDPCLLVLDDYHLIESQTIHDAVNFLLEHLPPQVHIAIATRADPPLPLARLRARGQLTEIRQDDLRFTPEETRDLLNQVMGLNLSPANISALQSRTEGWVAGLYMAVVSMRDKADRSEFIRSFTGSSHYILDYLIEEVLQLQPDFIQEFLLQASVLNRLCASLCEAVSDLQYPLSDQKSGLLKVGNCQQILEYLEHSNLFVIPLDDKQHWYRFHQLFADLLRQRLQQVQPLRVSVLHQRAGEWYEKNGFIPEAIEHALESKNFPRAADLIERIAETTLMHSEVTTLYGWVQALPAELLDSRPILCTYHAWGLLLSGHPLSAAEAYLQKAAKFDTTELVHGALAAFRALIATYQGDTRISIQLAEQALERLPESNLFLRSLVTGSLSLNYFWRGDIEPALRTLEEAARLSHMAGNLMNEVLAITHLGDVCNIQGRFRQAREYYEQAIDLATDTHGQQLPIAGVAFNGLGNILRESNNLDQAFQCLHTGIDLIKKWSEVGAINGYIALARVCHANGDTQGAQDAMQAAFQAAGKFDAMKLDDQLVAVQQARLWVWQGNIHAAVRWVEGKGYRESNIAPGEIKERITAAPLPIFTALEYMTLAQIYLAQGKPDRAQAVLEPLIQVFEEAGWHGILVYVLALQALAVRTLGDRSKAISLLERALTVTETEGVIQTFVEEGESMRLLIAEFQLIVQKRPITDSDMRHKQLLAYTDLLLSAFADRPVAFRVDQPSSTDQTSPDVVSMIEPLSEREIEVLQLLSRGLSSTEIAGHLIISANTVRSHMKTIYGKLNVHSRYEAVERAKLLKLI